MFHLLFLSLLLISLFRWCINSFPKPPVHISTGAMLVLFIHFSNHTHAARSPNQNHHYRRIKMCIRSFTSKVHVKNWNTLRITFTINFASKLAILQLSVHFLPNFVVDGFRLRRSALMTTLLNHSPISPPTPPQPVVPLQSCIRDRSTSGKREQFEIRLRRTTTPVPSLAEPKISTRDMVESVSLDESQPTGVRVIWEPPVGSCRLFPSVCLLILLGKFFRLKDFPGGALARVESATSGFFASSSARHHYVHVLKGIFVNYRTTSLDWHVSSYSFSLLILCIWSEWSIRICIKTAFDYTKDSKFESRLIIFSTFRNRLCRHRQTTTAIMNNQCIILYYMYIILISSHWFFTRTLHWQCTVF